MWGHRFINDAVESKLTGYGETHFGVFCSKFGGTRGDGELSSFVRIFDDWFGKGGDDRT